MCSVCPRGDAELNKTNDVIKRLSSFHGAVYIDTSNGFYDKHQQLRPYFYGERDWIHLSQSGVKRLLGTINSHINIVESFKNCAYPAPSKHDPRLKQPQRKQQNLHHRQAESRLEIEESFGSQHEPDSPTNIEGSSSERCMKCGLQNHTTDGCWHRAQVQGFSCRFYGHKDTFCWNK